MLNRRYWSELKKVGGQLASLEDYRFTLEKANQEAEEKLQRAYADAARRVEEAEQKSNSAVAAEAARIQDEYDRRLEHALGKAKEDDVMSYRRDRGRAVEQAT